jgi:shikimate kinase
MAKHVTLVGMMGSGKSSVAPFLAKRLKRQVIEVDQIIERREGMPIGEIFIAKGEAYFRRVERDVVAQLIELPAGVLSLGGGAFMWEATRNLLLEKTVVFYLSATLDVLHSRLMRTDMAMRPLLSAPGIDAKDTLRQLLERRGGYYGMAHYRVETDDQTPENVAKSIVMMREAYE